MSQLSLPSFASRKALKDIVAVPKGVQSVYSLTQHVWAGDSDAERQESKKKTRVRLETLDEFFLDPVRAYLNRIFKKIADGAGQDFWVQAEFDVGKSHLLAVTAVLAVGDKKPKTVSLRAFSPRAEFVWDAADIENVVSEFRVDLQAAWEEGCSLKIEKS
ncbi:MAG: hypothetical protein NZ578_05370 [Candidatus Binatia bacterium]|nr:hypothetical protein [Candidatus Binatia bacterium]